MRGDLGYSYVLKRPVTDLISERLPATIELAAGALLISLIIALPIGIISAVRQNSLVDRLSMAGAFLGISMPGFWLGIILILLLSVRLHFLPVQGRIGIDAHLQDDHRVLRDRQPADRQSGRAAQQPGTPGAAIHHPGRAGSGDCRARPALQHARDLALRLCVLARSKGAPESIVVLKHALRNALIPTVTVVGLQVGILLGGNMIIETVFSWPGLGRMVVDAIFNRDFPLIQGSVMIYAFTFVMANLIVDVLYTYLNPKISL